ncbi:MAG: nucleotide exchange factor GrpE [Chitinispirillaceae bacterium]
MMSSEEKKGKDKDQPEAARQESASAQEAGQEENQEKGPEEVVGEAQEEVGEITETLDDVKEQLEEVRDRHLRLMAEFDNYKRRTGRDFERLIESANEKLMLEFIDVRENFDRALKAGESGGEFQSFFDGMKLIYSKFNDILSKNGLEAFAEPGESFDPQIHDALMKSPHEEIPEDHIAQVFEKGYRLKNKVIKHARVIVSSGAPEKKNN